MLHIECFTFNAFQENTYLIINDKKQCWIIDPGMYENDEIGYLNQFIAENKLTPQAVINTHTHIDHIFGVQAMMDKYKIPFGIHEKDQPVLNGAAGAAMLFGFSFRHVPKPDFYISESKNLALGDDELEIRFTPGHSPGSITFYYPKANWAICGDVLFNGSIGRTDLPGGNFDTLINSIRSELFTMPANTIIYSGHGPSTNIAHEKQYNPFLNA
ncbi:MAG: MBL fold metallo-hydrolase [Bacteroidetes bacterium]|nr:MBL fold metallo-hydrolase [Bacteroidota bacterium]